MAAGVLVGLAVLLSFWSFRQIEEAAGVREHTYAVIGSAEALLSALKDAETDQRGYLLTGDEAFLAPHASLREATDPRLEELHKRALPLAARQHLDALTPLINAKLAEMSQAIELRRGHDTTAALALVRGGQGTQLMDSIRAEMRGFVELEQGLLAQREAKFQASTLRLFTVSIVASVLALLVALAFARLVYREGQQRMKDLVHLGTQHLLDIQEETNAQLQRANVTVRDSETRLAVTLDSIGDAVIATDAEARVTLLNRVAEQLTGWTQAAASGRPVGEIFRIINQETRQAAAIPVLETLAHGTKQGLANHTVLIARDGSECAIADSCAPIRDRDGQVIGAVLVFRDVTAEYAVRQALRTHQIELEMQNEELRQSQESLQAARLRYFDLYDLAPVGYCTINERGLILEANLTAANLFGVTRESLVRRPIVRFIAREDADRYYLMQKRIIETAEPQSAEFRMVNGGGTPFWAHLYGTAAQLDGAPVGRIAMTDISARKRAEEALREASALKTAIFNSANFSCIATDAKGVIQLFNVGAERMLGYAAADVLNSITPADISDSQEVIARAEALSLELGTTITPGFEALAFKASRGIEDVYELTYIRQDGSRFPAVVSVTALRDDHDVIIGYLLIGIDNTERKRVEAERERLDQALRDKNVELENARSVAENANRAKSEFLSGMSHELRTPLNAILGFAQLMESGSPPPTNAQKRSIDQILKAGWYLLELINEILDLALIESGKATLSHEPVSLAEVLLECRAMIEPQAQKRGIGITFPRFERPCFVSTDRTRVKQVLINLLSNAIKYNKPEGSVVVEYGMLPPNSIRIGIRDSGAGLPAEQLGQLFQPFNRLGREATAEEGTGIGLMVTKRLVELMGGTIGVDSTVGVGSVFWVELGLTTAPLLAIDETEQAALVRPQVSEGTPLRTVLYVEDNPANLELVEQLIARRTDLTMLGAADGDLAIEFARIYQPEVILMDINLPGISGLEAMRILRADPATAHIPIIALSANAVPRDIEHALAAGFFKYLTKPIKVDQFMEALDMALTISQTAAQATAGRAGNREEA